MTYGVMRFCFIRWTPSATCIVIGAVSRKHKPDNLHSARNGAKCQKKWKTSNMRSFSGLGLGEVIHESRDMETVVADRWRW